MTRRRAAKRVAACGLVWSIAVGVHTDVDAQGITTTPTATQASLTPLVPSPATFFPGSLSLGSGLSSPLEDDNLLVTFSVEQGVSVIRRGSNRVVPFVTVLASGDQRGFDWNNKISVQAGTKYVRAFKSGVVQIGGGYGYERRFDSAISQARPLWFGNYWFGWQLSATDRFPGSSWATFGTPAPTERKNLIAMSSVEQGVTVLRVARIAIVPFIEHLLALDSAGRPWNNRQLAGEGIKFRAPIGGGTIEVAAVYKQERRWIELRSRTGATAIANLWYGWDPSRGR